MGPYENDTKGNHYYKLNIPYYYFSRGIISHEFKHTLQKDSCLEVYMNSEKGMKIFRNPPWIFSKKDFPCSEVLVDKLKIIIRPTFSALLSEGTSLSKFYPSINGIPSYELEADNFAKTTYDSIKVNISDWAKKQPWWVN